MTNAAALLKAAPPAFDWKNPDYQQVIAARLAALARLRANPGQLPALKSYYAQNPVNFILDWGTTSDPRGALLVPPRPVVVPFVLFPKQVECGLWMIERARLKQWGVISKSRDCGLSWLAMALAVTLCLFRRNLTIGVGSATEAKIDRSGDPNTLFFKARTFLENLPPELRGGFDVMRDSAHMRLIFSETGSAITGEAGDQIGRGGRSSIYIIDEAAHLERPHLIEASLASNTDCRIDISSAAGMNNPFSEKVHGGKVAAFRVHWRDDPRKDDAWYATQVEKLDPLTLSQEIDCDFMASTTGALIPAAWAQAAVGAAERLGIKPSGIKLGALDVADEGRDKNAFCGRYGIAVEAVESWSGKGGDIFETVCRAFAICDARGYGRLMYDAIGLGAGVRGDARIVSEQRAAANRPPIQASAYIASESAEKITRRIIPDRENRDAFANIKSASWWSLRERFRQTYRLVVEGRKDVSPDDIISLPADARELPQLLSELTQVTYTINAAVKIVINKTPDGMRSPNLADAVAIAFSPGSQAENLAVWARLGANT